MEAKSLSLGFPANNFLWQEPGSNEDIATFCEKNYGVSFQMFEKISVKGKTNIPFINGLKQRPAKSRRGIFANTL